MGLMDKIFNKAAVPSKMIFDNFAKNYRLNLNRVEVVANKLKKDNKKIKNNTFFSIFIFTFFAVSESLFLREQIHQ